ncbi:MAG: SDR family oxidoreductase [Cephaloticoccus sp.]|nr:SDR family oxidoreductase [Cephaloticoccus sp.]
MRLQGKVIIITGSTTGIGRAIAERCVAEGAQVVVHGRDLANGEKLVAKLGAAAALHLDDLSDPGCPARLAEAAMSAFGRIDGIVNNAAIVSRRTIHNATVEDFDYVMAVNVRAPLFLIQAAFPQLKANHGSVLNIGSINALSGEATFLHYATSKGALQTLSRNLANAHATDQVRFTHFNVGWVLTDNENRKQIEQGLPKDWSDKVPPLYAPSGKLIMPEAIAAAAVFWLSDESKPISGTVMELEQFSVYGRNPVKT